MIIPPLPFSNTLYDTLSPRKNSVSKDPIEGVSPYLRNICFQYLGDFQSEAIPWTLEAHLKVSAISRDASTHYYLWNYNEGVFEFIAMFDSEENRSSSLVDKMIADHFLNLVKEPFLKAYRNSLH